MSQKKVDAYKKEKANRSEIIKREKRILMIEKLIGIVVCLLLVSWIGFSVYSKVTSNTNAVAKETVIDATALDDYAAGINVEETDAEAEDAETDVTDAAEEAETEEAAEETAE